MNLVEETCSQITHRKQYSTHVVPAAARPRGKRSPVVPAAARPWGKRSPGPCCFDLNIQKMDKTRFGRTKFPCGLFYIFYFLL